MQSEMSLGTIKHKTCVSVPQGGKPHSLTRAGAPVMMGGTEVVPNASSPSTLLLPVPQ